MIIKKKLILSLSALCLPILSASSQNTTPRTFSLPYKEILLKTEWVSDYLSIKLSNARPRMGVLGLHYNLQVNKYFYFGLGTYGAVRGDNGGFFTLGINTGVRLPVSQKWDIDLGLYTGGGGARSLDGGGGLMLMPHAGLRYQLPNECVIGLKYSYVTFPSGGTIRSHQIGGTVTIPTSFSIIDSTPPLESNPAQSHYHSKSDTHLFIVPIVQMYTKKCAVTHGGIAYNRSYLIGFEGGKYIYSRALGSLNLNVFTSLRTTAVCSGSLNGYMTIMGGIGLELNRGILPHNLSFILYGAVGSGGGGDADTGGGVLAQVDAGFSYSITPRSSLRALIGYLIAPGGRFKTGVITTGLHHKFTWYSGSTYLNTDHHTDSAHKVISQFALSGQSKILINPKRKDNRSGAIQFLDIHLDQFLGPKLYLTYQGAFAYGGENTAGLATGLMGVGTRIPLHKKVTLFGEITLGAAGGGGLDVGGGIIGQGEIGCIFPVHRKFDLKASVGRIISIKGRLNSTLFGLGFRTHFGKLTHS